MSGPRPSHPNIDAAAAGAAPAFALGADGAVLWANAAAEHLLGVAGGDLPATPPPGSPLAAQAERLATIVADNKARLIHLRVGAGRRPLTCRAEPLVSRDGIRFVLLSTLDADDIGEIPPKPAEEMAAATEEPASSPSGLIAELRTEPPIITAGSPAESPARLPLRVLWQTDAEGKILFVSPDPATTLGVPVASPVGRRWSDFATDDGRLQRVLGGRDTWSGIFVSLPIDGGLVLRTELSGLPMFDRDRAFRGFRGFGVIHEPPQIAVAPAGPHPPDVAESPADQAAAVTTSAEPPPLAGREPRPALAPQDRTVLREIARALGGEAPASGTSTERCASGTTPALPGISAGRVRLTAEADTLAVLDALPTAVLIHRAGMPCYANRAFLDLATLPDLAALAARGLESLLEPASGSGLHLLTGDGRTVAVDGHLKTITWDDAPASLLTLREVAPAPVPEHNLEERIETLEQESRELRAILDTAADGVLLLDAQGRVLMMNRSAEALFGYDAGEMEGRSFTLLFATESQRATLAYLESLRAGGVAAVLNDGREVLGMVRRGGAIPLFMTLGRIGEAAAPRFCAVLRDLTPFKRGEEELRAAKAEAERATAQKSAFLARMGHEIRTPLNAILGFAEMMIEERFGPIPVARYKEYLKDIHASGNFVISLVNDLLDLSKVEAGRLDLDFVDVNLNEVVAGAVALLQPQANRGRIIIRTSLALKSPTVKADLRSLKQIALNLLSNAVKFTPPGGQVIVSTASTDSGEAVVRLRDTGAGMSESEITTALEPFGQVSPTVGGSGLGLPLTKALVEANKATFALHSQPGAGTLVEIIFPPSRVLAG